VLIQPGRSLCGGGASVAEGFVDAQEGGNLCGRGEAGEEVAEDGCIFDLVRGWDNWGTAHIYERTTI
jgi:hypothetical protein